MSTPKKYMYRVEVIDEPEWEERECFRTFPQTSWNEWGEENVEEITTRSIQPVPKGWEPTEAYIERFKTDEFIEPSTNKWFRSRTSAKHLASLMESYGYEVIIQRSAPVQWPEGTASTVDTSPTREVLDAIQVLVRHGVIKSADDVIGLCGRKQ